MSRIGRFVRGIVLLRRHDGGDALSKLSGVRHIALLVLRQYVLDAEDLFHAGH